MRKPTVRAVESQAHLQYSNVADPNLELDTMPYLQQSGIHHHRTARKCKGVYRAGLVHHREGPLNAGAGQLIEG